MKSKSTARTPVLQVNNTDAIDFRDFGNGYCTVMHHLLIRDQNQSPASLPWIKGIIKPDVDDKYENPRDTAISV